MKDVKFFVGTSGYAYKEWKGSFYPEDLAAAKMLGYYGQRFGAVEMNGTFYRLPTAKAVEAWAKEVPAEFRFAVKAPQLITHFRRLKETKGAVRELFEVVGVLGKQLGPVLFQLPPNFAKDVERLQRFLKELPRESRVAFEFRHASWFCEEVYAVLREHRVALCWAEAEEGTKVATVATSDWGYLRLRLEKYGAVALKKWVKRVREQDWREAYVFFKHEETGTGPRFARRFLAAAKG